MKNGMIKMTVMYIFFKCNFAIIAWFAWISFITVLKISTKKKVKKKLIFSALYIFLKSHPCHVIFFFFFNFAKIKKVFEIIEFQVRTDGALLHF